MSKNNYFSYNADQELMTTFRMLRRRAIMFDITFGCIDSRTKTVDFFNAHSAIVATFSPVLNCFVEKASMKRDSSLGAPLIQMRNSVEPSS